MTRKPIRHTYRNAAGQAVTATFDTFEEFRAWYQLNMPDFELTAPDAPVDPYHHKAHYAPFLTPGRSADADAPVQHVSSCDGCDMLPTPTAAN